MSPVHAQFRGDVPLRERTLGSLGLTPPDPDFTPLEQADPRHPDRCNLPRPARGGPWTQDGHPPGLDTAAIRQWVSSGFWPEGTDVDETMLALSDALDAARLEARNATRERDHAHREAAAPPAGRDGQ